MNWLLVLTVLFVAANIVWGFYRGFLRVLYSMVAWIVILVAVSWLSPYVANYLTEHTRLDTYIEEGCNQKLHEWADAKKQEDKKEVKERGNDMGMPEIILEKLTGESKIADQLLEDTGVYEVITQKMVQMTIQGVTYIIVFVLILIATRFIFIAFKIVDKLPLIGGINRAIGAVAGFVKGMVIVWIVFACVAMTVTTSFGQEIVQAIYASPLLIWLYENNLILTLLMNIL